MQRKCLFVFDKMLNYFGFMQEPFQNIRVLIASLIDINDEEWTYYSAMFEIKKFKKKEIILQVGEVAKSVFFVNKGLLRIYFLDKNQKECTFHFAQELGFATDYESFLRKTPSKYSIQAMEDTEVVIMSHFMVHDGYKGLRYGEKLGRLLAETHFFLFSNKLLELYTQTPLERYEQMNKLFPKILQRVPQHYIASYLNISSVHLSRIINEQPRN